MLAFPRLPENINADVPDDLKTYTELKKFILSLYEKSSQRKIEEALGEMHLENRKPSQFIRHIKSKLRDIGLEPNDELLKNRLIKAMPESVRITLTALQSLDMTSFCSIADNLFDLVEDPVCHVSTYRSKSGTDSYARPARPVAENPYPTCSTPRGNHGHFPFHPDQRQKICRCHIYFGENARRCKVWCRWPGRKPSIIDPSSTNSSRNSSRASSPAPALN